IGAGLDGLALCGNGLAHGHRKLRMSKDKSRWPRRFLRPLARATTGFVCLALQGDATSKPQAMHLADHSVARDMVLSATHSHCDLRAAEAVSQSFFSVSTRSGVQLTALLPSVELENSRTQLELMPWRAPVASRHVGSFVRASRPPTPHGPRAPVFCAPRALALQSLGPAGSRFPSLAIERRDGRRFGIPPMLRG